MPGKIPAHATAKIVIASAARLMLVRQLCRKRKRIAEISVPACPIPTQKTKLTIGNPQATGELLPQTPTPRTNRYPIERNSTPVTDEEMATIGAPGRVECNTPAADVCNGSGACQCNDTIQNGAETDVDCGGVCQTCADGATCLAGTDCTSTFCASSSR